MPCRASPCARVRRSDKIETMSSITRRNREAARHNGGYSCAVIDIGSNTVRMVVYGGSPRAPSVLMNEKVTARLGRDLADTGRMPDEAMELALAGLARFALILSDLEIEDVQTVATAAVRDASNGAEFLAKVRDLGLSPELISGEEEARISAMGVTGAFPGRDGVVADLGGGSLELVAIRDGEPQGGVSMPLGTLRLAALLEQGEGRLDEVIEQALHDAGWDHSITGPLFMVGGTWRAMALYAMHRQSHPLSDPHGLGMTSAEAAKLAKRIARTDNSELKAVPRVSSMRAAILPGAAVLLGALLARLQPEGLVFSSWGLREGLLNARLSKAERAQDPLLAGVGQFSSQIGASPAVSARVAGWTVAALPGERHGTERLRLAATMLALASMQVEPNLRTTQAVEWALYKRWLDLSDTERGMLAAAIMANSGQTAMPEAIAALAPEDRLHEAIGWGLAIRLCRRLGGQSRKSLNVSVLAVEGGDLRLYLRSSHAALYGSPTRKDMKLLAEHMGLNPAVEILSKDDFTAKRDEIADRKWADAISAK